ncbi:restriction endonuclease subunit S [Flavobacterium johnsoniae]|uniref:restriction endonuclease subunit S n=1 Tax=Flavobacterium johnsoniae TaxID=986 RepID=UPI0025B08BB7|nr:restriction endonuclease subunit S [Flavobacterium johnsoniae]WJS96779.1 restriction endonuclease subunit S [Flavobacterium johnsoniae]
MSNYLDWQNKISPDRKIVPLFHVANYRISPVDKIVKDNEDKVRLCNYMDVYKNTYITSDLDFMKGSATENEIEKFLIQRGDVLITKDSESWNDIGIPAIVSGDFENITVCGYHLALLRPKTDLITPKFLYYSFESKEHRLQLEIEATGVTRFGIPKDAIGKYKLPLPSISKQNKIVTFLDKEVMKIDLLIENKTKLIALFEEKRKTIINQSVTKGLDLNTAMKDSGIEWLGEIPNCWNLERLKFLTKKIGSGVTPLGGANIYTDTGILFLRSQNIYNDGLRLNDETFIPEDIHKEMRSSQVQKGDLLLNITGGSIGRCYYFNLDIEANINQHVCIIRVNKKILYRYLHFVIISLVGQYQIDLLQYGGGREAISFENIKNFSISFPQSIESQKEIVKFLDKECLRFDKITNKIKTTIDLLKEKRTAIISAAINGEIEI